MGRPSVTRRLPLAAAVVFLAALTFLAGCSGGPSPQTGAGATAKGSRAAGGGPGTWHPAKPDTNGPVVAVWGNHRLTRRDIDSVVAGAPLDIQPRLKTFDGYRQVVERLIFEETLLDLARHDSIEADPAYQVDVAKAIRSAKLRAYYNRRLAALPGVPDSAVAAYYQAHLADYKVPARIRVRHIQLATQKEAASVRKRLARGGLWDELCKKYSKDPATKDKGGLVGYVTPESDMVSGIGSAPAIVAAAFALKEGEISQPLKGPKGWHLIQADDLVEPSVQSYDAVKARIRSDLEGQAVDDFSQALTDSLKQVSNAAIFDDSITVAVTPARTAADYFKDAQSAPTPEDRVKLYKRLVALFPTDTISVQARFMIGFTYAEDMGDYEAAKEAFDDFIRLYPNSELANSARWMMNNMEKPPPPLQEDAAPSDSTKTPSGTGGGAKKAEPARRSP